MWQGDQMQQWNNWHSSQQSARSYQDWAALAQQWISMKDKQDAMTMVGSETNQIHPNVPFTQSQLPPLPPLPPPLPPGGMNTVHTENSGLSDIPPGSDNIAGAMDMEIEDDKGTAMNTTEKPTEWQGWTTSSAAEWNPAAVAVSNEWAPAAAAATASTPWNYGWQGTVPQPINTPEIPVKEMVNYAWDPNIATNTVMPKVIDYNHRDRRKSRPGPVNEHSSGLKEDIPLDAAQRKRLPPWIREGLEKMEREKQRKAEREQMLSREEQLWRNRQEEEERARLAIKEGLNNDGIAKPPVKSKFESDDDSENGPEAVPTPTPTEEEEDPPSQPGTITFRPIKTEEERVADLMVTLKLTVTQYLLDVTSNMIREVATEVLNKAKTREPQVKKSSAISTLSGGLGLSIYSDSESDKDSDDEENLDMDSDDELQRTIRLKKQKFESIEREILQRIQREEEERLQKLNPVTRNDEDDADVATDDVNTEIHRIEKPNLIADPVVETTYSQDSTNGVIDKKSPVNSESTIESHVVTHKKNKKGKRDESEERSHKSKRKMAKSSKEKHKKSRKKDESPRRRRSRERKSRSDSSESVSSSRSSRRRSKSPKRRRSRSRSPRRRYRSRSVSRRRRRSRSVSSHKKRYSRSRSRSYRRRRSRSVSSHRHRRHSIGRRRHRNNRSRSANRKRSRVGRSKRSSS